jgi:four helix bundle protein
MLGVTRFEDLDVYKLAVQLRREVFRLSSSGPIRRDFKFVGQIRDAVRGGPRNISEGFSRLAPSEFSHFLLYAKASIDETKNHVHDGHECGYFSDEERDRLITLVRRTIAAINALMAYLDSSAAHRAYEALRKQRRERLHVRRKDIGKEREPANLRTCEPVLTAVPSVF